ncbi:LppP/LprE family lipoprotein [Rhodococcus sp. P-2]|uniref:LppP/LprE family lipoprotein n=1 Tax=Rhodococcus sp. P-2 TaxID=2795031 RepID=UPI001904CFCF|nr:LppP/LprE family lipoprotein [Rhodococcus sp. P-2]QQM22022.1 LppP/LprE family lipoprotein [Rhodococcus sp. P-2]
MATNSSPVAIPLLHDGAFVGPASTCYVTISAVEAAGENTVAVTYRYPELGDSNPGMTGRANYTLTWDSGKVSKVGTMPAHLPESMVCTL